MSRKLLLQLVVLVGTTPTFVFAGESVEFPKGTPPRFVMIVSIDEANGRLE